MMISPLRQKKPRGKKRGFTLIEMMVSVALFVMVMMILMNLFVSMLTANWKAQNQKFVFDNVYTSIEILIRHLRSGKDYVCAGGNCSSISFTDVDGHSVTYRKTGNTIFRSMDGGAFEAITASNVQIKNLTFYTFGDNTTTQPRVLVIIAGIAGKGPAQTTFNVQTTISQLLIREF